MIAPGEDRQLIAAFLEMMAAEAGAAVNTLLAYERDLRGASELLGGHHLEEGGDQLPVLPRHDHSRLSASAAIILASYSRPTCRSAATIW